MHRTTPAATALAAAAFLALHATTAEAQGARPCSEATLRGGYGYTVTGVTGITGGSDGVPFAAVGVLTFDGNGGFANVRTVSNGGAVLRNVPGTGTYALGRDCRGTLTFAGGAQGGATENDIVVDDRGDELRLISAANGTVLTLVGRKQF
jgi:uncharacterized membrane protein